MRLDDSMTPAELKALPIGAKIFWVFGSNEHPVRIPAKVVEHGGGQIALLVYFPDKPQARKRWSLTTNQPVGESKGYIGTVRLER